MENLWHNLPETSWLAGPVWLFLAILVASLGLTWWHAIEEAIGPYWSYMGAIAGVAFPDLAGIPVFFFTLTAPLCLFAFSGIAGWWPYIGQVSASTSMLTLGLLIGVRIADAWFSHYRLEGRGYARNPGLRSARWYYIEGIALIVLFAPGIWEYKVQALGGMAISTFFFAVTIPVTRFMGVLLPFLRRTPWQPGTPVPAWVRETPGNLAWLGYSWRDFHIETGSDNKHSSDGPT